MSPIPFSSYSFSFPPHRFPYYRLAIPSPLRLELYGLCVLGRYQLTTFVLQMFHCCVNCLKNVCLSCFVLFCLYLSICSFLFMISSSCGALFARPLRQCSLNSEHQSIVMRTTDVPQLCQISQKCLPVLSSPVLSLFVHLFLTLNKSYPMWRLFIGKPSFFENTQQQKVWKKKQYYLF